MKQEIERFNIFLTLHNMTANFFDFQSHRAVSYAVFKKMVVISKTHKCSHFSIFSVASSCAINVTLALFWATSCTDGQIFYSFSGILTIELMALYSLLISEGDWF